MNTRNRRRSTTVFALAMATGWVSIARAVDIAGVEPAALDQPRINAYVSLTSGGAPLVASDAGVDSFNIQAYYDTGASGVLFSTNTAALLNIQPSTSNGTNVLYSDVGVGGTSDFYVSDPLYLSLADFENGRDVDNPATYSTVYTNHFGPIRAEIGPANVDPDPALGDLDVFGMPTMAGKVLVMDPKPVNSFLDTMRTYVYAPNTPYNVAKADTNPGIPAVDKHVKLSYVSFDRFTKVTPAGAPGPTLRNNPFIGPNPFVARGTDTTPPVTISYGGASVNGSFLLDTGAAASIISNNKANALGVAYDPSTVGTDHPVLMFGGHPIADQFQLTIGGIGGSKVVSGFYLSSLLLHTQEGNSANPNDPNHLRFTDAPVLVSDISVANPNVPGDTYTLDGIFGMNYLVASASLLGADASGFPLIGNLSRGKFDWATFDEPNGVLGLKLATPQPQDVLNWYGDSTFSPQSNWDYVSAAFIGEGGFVPFTDGDQVAFSDIASSLKIRLNEVVTPAGVTFDNNIGDDEEFPTNYDLLGTGHIQGLGGLVKRGTAELRIHTSNTYQGATVVEAGTIIFFAGQDVGPLSVEAGAEVLFATSAKERFDSISTAGSITADGGSIIVTKKIAVESSGKFETNGAKLVVGEADSGAVSGRVTALALRDTLKDGYHKGAWDGPGIVAAQARANGRIAIGYIEADQKFGAGSHTWNGETVTAGQVLVALTTFGDANLDMKVNFDDLVALAQHYGKSGQVWSTGDFNYDGVVNFDDLIPLAQNYGRTGAVLVSPALFDSSFVTDWAFAQSLVPEPTALLGLTAAGVLRRRR